MTFEDKEITFRKKANKFGYKVNDYSGRGMFGRKCPSVTVNNPNDFIAEMGMKGLKIDNMACNWVVYTG